MPAPDAYSPEELMAVLISRQVRDGETVAVGAVSPIPAAGCVLAEHTHAPDISLIILDCEAYYPFSTGSSALHFLAQRGELDLFFLSGLQLDRRGNVNLHVIGDYACPSVRMAGAYGSAMLYYMAHRVILFRTEHSRRTLVEQVDFVTSPGITPESVHREGGPTLLITPQASLAWKTDEWRCHSIHPGYSAAEIQHNTGFDLAIPPNVPHTSPPTAAELHILRTTVRVALAQSYPEFFRDKIRPVAWREA